MGGIGRHQILYRQARTKHKEQERRKKAAVDAGTKKKASRSKRRSIDLTRVPEKRQEWQVHIKTLTGREFDVIVNPYDDIEDLRIKIGLKEDCSFDQIILISEGGRILHDGDTLMDWHIGQGSTVFMNFRLRGG